MIARVPFGVGMAVAGLRSWLIYAEDAFASITDGSWVPWGTVWAALALAAFAAFICPRNRSVVLWASVTWVAGTMSWATWAIVRLDGSPSAWASGLLLVMIAVLIAIPWELSDGTSARR